MLEKHWFEKTLVPNDISGHLLDTTTLTLLPNGKCSMVRYFKHFYKRVLTCGKWIAVTKNTIFIDGFVEESVKCRTSRRIGLKNSRYTYYTYRPPIKFSLTVNVNEWKETGSREKLHSDSEDYEFGLSDYEHRERVYMRGREKT